MTSLEEVTRIHPDILGINKSLLFSYGYGSIPIHTVFRGMNIHLPAILMFTRGTRFWHTAIYESMTTQNTWYCNYNWSSLHAAHDWTKLDTHIAAYSTCAIVCFIFATTGPRFSMGYGELLVWHTWNILRYHAMVDVFRPCHSSGLWISIQGLPKGRTCNKKTHALDMDCRSSTHKGRGISLPSVQPCYCLPPAWCTA